MINPDATAFKTILGYCFFQSVFFFKTQNFLPNCIQLPLSNQMIEFKNLLNLKILSFTHCFVTELI